MFTKLKEKFSQQPLKFDDLEGIIPHDVSVDYDDVYDDVNSDELFTNRRKKNSFSMSPSTNLFTSGNNSARELGPRKNSFNKLFLNSPSQDENAHPNLESNKTNRGLEKAVSMSKVPSKSANDAPSRDAFKMRTMSEALPQQMSPAQDDRFVTSRPVRDSPTSSSAAAAKIPSSIFINTMFSPEKQPQPAVVTRNTQIWSHQSKQEPVEEKEEHKHEEYSYYYGDENNYYDQYAADTNYSNNYDTSEYQYTEEPSFSVDVEALFSKVRHNHGEYIAQQLSGGLDPNIVDSNGNTMLHICAQNNNKKIASLLLSAENIVCDVNTANKKLHTPLDYAEKYGHAKLAQYLKAQGAVSGLQQQQQQKDRSQPPAYTMTNNHSNVRYR